MQRGEIYRLHADFVGKSRPVVIVSRDSLNGGHSVIAVPFTSQQLEKRRHQPWCAVFNAGDGNLDKDCVAKGDEVATLRKIDLDAAKGPIGRMNAEQLDCVTTAVRYAIRADGVSWVAVLPGW